MMSVSMMTPSEMQKRVASRERNLRLEINLSQQSLSEKSGISYSSLKKFEKNRANMIGILAEALSLDELLENRKRGRK